VPEAGDREQLGDALQPADDERFQPDQMIHAGTIGKP
jgi:hypothetical protein